MENRNYSTFNKENLIAKYVGMINSLKAMGKAYNYDLIREELMETKDFQNKQLTEEMIDKIILHYKRLDDDKNMKELEDEGVLSENLSNSIRNK